MADRATHLRLPLHAFSATQGRLVAFALGRPFIGSAQFSVWLRCGRQGEIHRHVCRRLINGGNKPCAGATSSDIPGDRERAFSIGRKFVCPHGTSLNEKPGPGRGPLVKATIVMRSDMANTILAHSAQRHRRDPSTEGRYVERCCSRQSAYPIYVPHMAAEAASREEG